MWCVCTHPLTHTEQSPCPRLWEWLGLPDLHFSRNVYRQRGDEISLSIALSSLFHILCSFWCLFIASWTHTHTHTQWRWRSSYDFLACMSSCCRWNRHRQSVATVHVFNGFQTEAGVRLLYILPSETMPNWGRKSDGVQVGDATAWRGEVKWMCAYIQICIHCVMVYN